MLHWLAGQRPTDNGFDPDVTALTEGPATPAPVFAVRAFKHAIFGTPQVDQSVKPRRHSATDNTRPKTIDTKQARPTMIRPKSWHDAQGLERVEQAMSAEPLPSPTKGILLTPGTAAAKRKTVSFGDHVVDNEGKRPTRSGLPDDYPGKFPSPWSKTVGEAANHGNEDDLERPMPRIKFSEALEQVREESAKQKRKHNKPVRLQARTVAEVDNTASLSDHKDYWKQEYDIYRENTMREVKKLVAKQRAAKNFAHDKDVECTELKEQLAIEQGRASLLQQRTAELEAQLKDCQELLQKSQKEHEITKKELRQFESANGLPGEKRPTFAEQIDATRGEKREKRTLTRPRSAILNVQTETASALRQERQTIDAANEDTNNIPSNYQRNAANPKVWPRRPPSKAHEGPKAPPLASSAVSYFDLHKRRSKTTAQPAGQPLSSIDINAASQETRSIALSMGLQPPSPVRESRQDSPLSGPDHILPLMPDDGPPIKASEETLAEPPSSPPLQHYNSIDVSAQIASFSTFIPDADSELLLPQPLPPPPPPPTTTAPAATCPPSPVAARAAARTAATNMRPADVKENIAPPASRSAGPAARNEENLKPSAAWTGLTSAGSPTLTAAAAAGAKRIISKDGQEVDADRIAAARARIIARGRQVS